MLDASAAAETRLRESQSHVEHLNRLLRTSQRISKMLGSEKEREVVLRETCRILVDEGGLRGAWVGLPEVDGTVTSAASSGISLNLYPGQVRWDDTALGRGPMGRALRLGAIGVLRDLDLTPSLGPWAKTIAEHQIRSLAALPLLVRGAPVAALAFYSQRGDSFGPEVMALMEEIAREVGRALEQRDDQAQRKGAEDALRASEAKLIVIDRLATVGRLAAGVAHEINNPLAYVMMNTSAALQDLERARQLANPSQILATIDRALEALRDAREGNERVRLIVRDLKQFSRPADAAVGPENLESIIEFAISVAWNEIQQSAQLIKDYAPCPPVAVNGPRLGQVFLNLLVNAAQAIGRGAAAKNQIRIVISVENGRAVVLVKDSGPGIPVELRERIFEPFFTTKPVGEGTGLGLAICHSIIAEAKGELTLHSPPGEGATFRVSLPLSQVG